MAYNHGREDRKWRIWKEAEEKLLRECGVDEATIEQIRIADRADFNSNRRRYHPYTGTERGCATMSIFSSFLLSVLASVVAYYICKWLDGDK